ncbi:lysoplasmalogenase family protein [Vibrio sp. MA40-2]|uniref:lysoplasmalogenase family protein n=1 Tax=Vibrio sp. MA40-2 TaxID=3391828 RepID=UPI0039A4612A
MFSWLVVGLSGVIHIFTANGNHKQLSYVFRTVALLSLIVLLFLNGSDKPQFIWVATGLVLSCFSDIAYKFLKPNMSKSFVVLLIAFVSYSKGFWSQLHGDIAWWVPALLIAGSVIIVLLLLPKLDTIILPISIIGLVMLQMFWAALAVWMNNASIENLYGCLACIILIFTMVLDVINNYRTYFTNVESWVSGGFLIGHSLIVASVIA